jgi:proline racemase/trans-L-3-hydroxyproline dehydratase
MQASHSINTVDTHTEGQPTRIITAGVGKVPGQTMLEKQQYFREHLDHLRTALLHEPRGHRDMFGCVLTEPTTDEADFGILFMHNSDYMDMCGHGTIGLATAAVELGMVKVESPETRIIFDTPRGLVTATARVDAPKNKVTSVTFENIPAYVDQLDASVEVSGLGNIPVDVSYGGNRFVWYSADQVGVEICPQNAGQIVEVAMQVMAAANEQLAFLDPLTGKPGKVNIATVMTEPQDKAHQQRHVHVFGDGQIDRSPGGTGTSARLAVLYARGLIDIDQTVGFESGMTGGVFHGRVLGETKISDQTAYRTTVTGTAHITGTHQFVIDPDDPLKDGFLVDA